MRGAPVLVGILAMAIYLVWVCLRMAMQTPYGVGLLAVIFAGAAIGIVAGLVGAWHK